VIDVSGLDIAAAAAIAQQRILRHNQKALPYLHNFISLTATLVETAGFAAARAAPNPANRGPSA
jgi:hypothetical protein